jgi:hypothetical protein
MQLRLQFQQNPVTDEVSSITAVVRPILESLLYALKADVVAEVGTHTDVKLKMLPRLYRRGDRDCGICLSTPYTMRSIVVRRDQGAQRGRCAGRKRSALSGQGIFRRYGANTSSTEITKAGSTADPSGPVLNVRPASYAPWLSVKTVTSCRSGSTIQYSSTPLCS